VASLPLPEDLLKKQVSELSGYSLELQCACGLSGKYPLASIAEQRAGSFILKSFLERLRCKRCNGEPTSIALSQTGTPDEPSGKGVSVKRKAAANSPT
jgi:hypothetical protein